MSGDERRTDWYWRCSCDLRNSGGLYEGGWVEGWREIGRGALVICSMVGAGVVALAVAADACRHWKQTYCVAGVVVRRTCFAARWRCSLGAMVGGDVYVSSVVLRQ